MILVVDIGNSRIKWGCHRHGRLEETGTMTAGAEGDEWADWEALERPERVVVANVAGAAAAEKLQDRLSRLWRMEPEFVGSSARCCGVVNGYRYPERLGVDRWAALVAARHLTSRPVIVVDCGTALTLDALDAEGFHLGGLILPGLALMRDSLVRGTMAITSYIDTAGKDATGLGRDTGDCIRLGVMHGAAGLIERVKRQLEHEGRGPECILCGGDAHSLWQWLGEEACRHEPHLVLQGLVLMAGDQRIQYS